MPKKQKSNIKNTPVLSTFLQKPVVWIGLALIVAVLIGLAMMSGKGSSSSKLAAEIDTVQANKLYQDKNVVFIDVREQSEWDSFHSPGTTLIPLGQLANRLKEIPKDRPVVVVCRSGNRSQQGRDILKQAGYTNVTSMAGGVTSWKSQGFPIEP